MNPAAIARGSPFLSRYGRWAVVTGASDGIGREFARELALKGLSVVLVARRLPELQALAEELRATHSVGTRMIAVDLATDAGNDHVLAQTAELDVGLLVACAGFGTSGDFVNGAIDAECDMLDVNCRSTLRLSWHFGRVFQGKRRGGIVLLSSIVAFQGTPKSAHYAATKAYVQTLAEGLRAELKGTGVDVLAVAPGPVATGFAARANLRMTNAMTPNLIAVESLKRLGRTTTARPGFLSKLLGYSLAMTPRWGRVKIMNAVMSGMTAHQRK